jgi:hypothetical protein
MALAAPVHAAPPHVHGVAKLDIALDGETLSLGFECPLDSLVGFEHKAANPREERALLDAKAKFAHPESLFLPSPEARCTSKPAAVKENYEEGGHADFDVDMTFRCERPAELKRLEAKVFKAFPRLQHVDVQLSTPRKQSAATLTPSNDAIAF